MTKFQEYFTEQIKNFNEYHSKLLVLISKEDIHSLRTILKKLRTFNNLLDGLLFKENDFPIELLKLFKSTGGIRDIQIQESILEGYKDPYIIHLYEQEYQLSQFEIKNNYGEEIQYLTDKLNKVEDYQIDDQIIKNIRSKIERNYNELREMIANVSPENLHEIRKKIKRIYYTLLMLGDEKNEKLDNMQEMIGLWHDYDVTIGCIKEYDNNLDIINSLTEKRDSFYNESLKLIRNL